MTRLRNSAVTGGARAKTMRTVALICLGLVLPSLGAQALPEEPLSSPLLIYDANHKLVGPMMLGQTYITIDDQAYILPIDRNSLNYAYSTTFHYTDERCKSDPFLEEKEFVQAPEIIAYGGKIYFPYREPEVMEIKSRRVFHLSSGVSSCIDDVFSKKMLRMRVEPESFLGIAYPVRLERRR